MSYSLLYILVLPQLIVFGTIDRIQKSLEKKEYEKAYELIARGLQKEPENPGIDYYKAILYFDLGYNQYNLDSARNSIRSASEKFAQSSEDEKQKRAEEGISKETIKQLEVKIRDREFQNTLADISISSIERFEQNYPESIYDKILTYKEDSLAFDLAFKKGTQAAYLAFIRERPTSVFTAQADSLLDYLRVDELLTAGSLQDYYTFLQKFPLTRGRYAIERYILKVSTASHQAEQYERFLRLSRRKSLKKIAGDYYYSRTGQISPLHPKADSLREIKELEDLGLFPTLRENLFGFQTASGKTVIPHQYANIPTDARCKLVVDDWIFVNDERSGKILRKDGATILKNVDDYRSINPYLALVSEENQWTLYHKSGYQVFDEQIEDAEVVGNQWIRYRQQAKYGLISFLGLSIARATYDDIYSLGPFWIFEKDHRLAVYTEDLILREVEDKGLALEFKFDDVELVNDSTLIGFRANRECLLDETLNYLIPWGEYEINPDPEGWYLRLKNGYKIYDPKESEVLKRVYPYIESSQNWLALKTNEDWMLIPRTEGILPSRGYDSIKLIGNHAAWVRSEDQKSLIFNSGEKLQIEEEKVRLIGNQTSYLLIEGTQSLSLRKGSGESLVTGDFQELAFLNDTLLRVQVRNKQGLMGLSGEWVLNPIFQTLDEKDGLVLTLEEGQIGCFDLENQRLLPAAYEARIERIGDLYLAKKGGNYGLVNAQEEPVIDFAYSEIKRWNDSSYLVTSEGISQLISSGQEPLSEPFENAKFLLSNVEQEIYRIVQNGKYGLMSNRYGQLLKAEYTDILNIGTQEEPLFFADQHLDKAGFHVVSYIDSNGKLILSKAYTRPEFDRILCDD